MEKFQQDYTLKTVKIILQNSVEIMTPNHAKSSLLSPQHL